MTKPTVAPWKVAFGNQDVLEVSHPSTARVLNMVLSSTTALFRYWIVLFNIFINCGTSSRYFMPVLAGEK
jgi:hypothetical protein